MQANDAGEMIQTVWDEIPTHYPGIDIDEFVVMPNHIHGIIAIVGAAPCGRPGSEQPEPIGQPRQTGKTGQPQGVAPTAGLSLSDVAHRLKTMTTKRYADGVKQNGWPPFSGKLWQRNYWEHIIRDESEWNRIRNYINNNPAQWESDKLHPNQPEFGGGADATCGRGTARRAPTTIREPSSIYGPSVGDPSNEGWMV